MHLSYYDARDSLVLCKQFLFKVLMSIVNARMHMQKCRHCTRHMSCALCFDYLMMLQKGVKLMTELRLPTYTHQGYLKRLMTKRRWPIDLCSVNVI